MKAPWEYFEDLGKLLYVADMETYELVYMNRYARERFGFSGETEYLGKKCHEILQQFLLPCPFCTNTRLRESNSLEWSYRNPANMHRLRISDNVVFYQNRRYHLTSVVDLDANDMETDDINSYVHYESFINECLIVSHSTADPDESLNLMLEHLGIYLRSSVLLYEQQDDQSLVCSYRWEISGGRHGPDTISAEETAAMLASGMINTPNRPLRFADIAELHSRLPAFIPLVREGADTLLLVPLLSYGMVKGCLWLDDIPRTRLPYAANICQVLSHFIMATLLRRDLMARLRQSSLHDQMTGALNRYALNEYIDNRQAEQPVGLIYCDVVGLKSINDLLGHTSGDELIISIYHILRDLFSAGRIYRMGGDEFLVICEGVPETSFEQQVDNLRREIVIHNHILSIGSVWAASSPGDFYRLIRTADARMYEDKRDFYSNWSPLTGRQTPAREAARTPAPHTEAATAFQSFLDHFYFDAESFFSSIAMRDTTFYLFCGDVQKNIYFISDNLKEDFQFADNLVYDFLTLLKQRIYKPDSNMHVAETQAMLRDKRTFYSVRCRIYNRLGELVWVHFRGMMKWNSDRTVPLFFSGSMVCLTNESEVDPVTGLLNRSSAVSALSDVCRSDSRLLLLCFTFQHFYDMELAFGHETGDNILREIGCQLEATMGAFFRFFRLSDTHFLAYTQQLSSPVKFVANIRRIVQDAYRKYGVHMMYPCAIGVLHYPQDGSTAKELIENALAVANSARAFPTLEYLTFSPQMSETYREQTDLSLALNHSIHHGFEGFRIVIQPQVHAATGEIFGGEVLLRWRHQAQNVPSQKCILFLERLGLIIPVGKWVITQTLQACQTILEKHPDFQISINVSYLQIMDSDLFPFIEASLRTYGIPGRNLSIELTETHFDEMPEHLSRFIRQCKNIGISFVLDDFGSAYSSLQLLLQYPADLIKLDRTLMREVTSSEKKLNFIISVIYACHRFGKKICVEGVETAEELQLIRQTDCDFIQGFYFYPPMEFEQLFQLLDADDAAAPSP